MILYESAAAFIIMFLLIRKRVPLGLSLMAGGLVVGFFGFGGKDLWFSVVYQALLSRFTLELTAIILLINMLGHAMKEYGNLDRLNTILGRIFPDKRYLMALFPAAIGMLSVPGGAILSAPIVEKIGMENGLSPERKVAINLIFRHFWFLSYPFYTSLIILQSLTGVGAAEMVRMGIIPTLVGFFASWKVCFQGWKFDSRKNNRVRNVGDVLQLFYNLSPIIAALVVAGLFHANYIIALIAGIIINEVINIILSKKDKLNLNYFAKKAKSFCVDTLLPSLKWQLILLPAGINFLRLSLDTAGVPQTLASLLLNLKIPLEALLFILPLIISFLTGVHLASVSISVPLFMPMLSGNSLVEPMFLLLTAATVGYWMSPFHLCLILNQQYFKAGYLGTVRLMVWPAVVVAAAGIAVFIVAKGYSPGI